MGVWRQYAVERCGLSVRNINFRVARVGIHVWQGVLEALPGKLSQLYFLGHERPCDSNDAPGFIVGCSPARNVASGIAMLETGQTR